MYNCNFFENKVGLIVGRHIVTSLTHRMACEGLI